MMLTGSLTQPELSPCTYEEHEDEVGEMEPLAQKLANKLYRGNFCSELVQIRFLMIRLFVL